MPIVELEKIVFTDNLKKLISLRSKNFLESDLVAAITNHAKNFMKESNQAFKDVEIPNLKLEIRIKRVSAKHVVVGLTKKLHEY